MNLFGLARVSLVSACLLVVTASCDGTPEETEITPIPNSVTSGPSTLPDKPCGVTEDCEDWACLCKPNKVVNAAECVDAFCGSATRVCNAACRNFGTEWTGEASGGPQ